MIQKKFDVLVIGELNVDLILNQIEMFPQVGKEIIASEMNLVLGSSSAIFASNLSSLGTKVSFLGKLGNDIFGNLALETLEDRGVDTNNIIVDKYLKTGATIVLNYNEDRANVTFQGAMNHLSIDDITDERLNRAKHVHISSVFMQPQIKADLIQIFEKIKSTGLSTSIDVQWDPDENWDIDLNNLLPLVDIFMPNEQELINLTGEKKIEDAICSIQDIANTVIIKRGSKGSILIEKGNRIELPAFLNTEVVDAIGAGDSFNSGFIHKYLQGKKIVECQKFGNLIGAINTTATGGTAAFTNYKQILSVAKEKFGYTE